MLQELKFVPADIDEGRVLRILNRSFLPLQDESIKPKYKTLARDFGIRPEMAPLIDKTATVELRRLVDNWIDSGREPNNSESPYRRSYRRAQIAGEAWMLYFQDFAQFKLLLSEGAPVLRFEPKLWEQVRDLWLQRESQSQQMRFYAKAIDFPVMNPEDPENELMLVYRMIAWVRHFTAAILLSDLRLRIAKCRYRKCTRPYFLLPHLPRKSPYNSGLFCCVDHNRKETAMKGMKQRRAEADRQLLEWAAQEFSRLVRTGPDTRVKEKIVNHLNERLARYSKRTRENVRANWVTRHWHEIQKKVEELGGKQWLPELRPQPRAR
jgi:hypothetical protein